MDEPLKLCFVVNHCMEVLAEKYAISGSFQKKFARYERYSVLLNRCIHGTQGSKMIWMILCDQLLPGKML